MHRLHRASPTWHAVAWIIIYVVTFGAGGALSATLGRENLATAPAVLVLAAVALVYLHRHGWRKLYGVTRVEGSRWRAAAWFLPLAAMAVAQLLKGLNPALGSLDVLLIVLLMSGVGFLEELLFRGFLYRAIRARGGVARAALISGVTFGIGHIVNLLNGYTGAQQVIQIVLAIGIGIALALLFEITGSILPGVVFHILLNISGSVTLEDDRRELYAATAVMVIAVTYALGLWVRLRRGFGKERGVNLDGGLLAALPRPGS